MISKMRALPGMMAALFMATLLIAPAFGDLITVNLIADGRDEALDIGGVTVSNDATNLYVTFTIDLADWYLAETHVAVASDLAGIPQTGSGNPKVGKFAYQAEHTAGIDTTYTYTIPLVPTGQTVTIAAQAQVEQWGMVDTDLDLIPDTYMAIRWESAWGEGTQFPGNNWAMYFTYTTQVPP